jgi:hypothetical protein
VESANTMADGPRQYTFDGSEAIDEAEQHTREALLRLPDGYDRVGILWPAGGGAMLAIGGADVPAMAWCPTPAGSHEWRRVYPAPCHG